MKILLVVNPISGGVDKEPFLQDAKAFFKFYSIDYQIFKTTGSNDDNALKESIERYKPDRIASVGGDGTTLFTAVNLIDSDIPMGIIPLGSANGMAVELGVKSEPMQALKDLILSQRIEGLDILLVNDKHYSIHIGDVGVNAHIVEAYDKDPNRGMLTYAKYFIEELKELKTFNIRIEIDGEIIEKKVFMAAFCNARKFGTGIPLNTISNPMDGKFEITLLNKLDAKVLLKSGLARFNENFMDLESTQVLSTNYAKIFFEAPQLLQLDGEVIGNYTELTFEILPSAVRFITHRGNPYIA